MNVRKKAQGLPMNTIVIAILVLVVLVIIIAFFVGGTSTIASQISGIFGGATAGQDISLARNLCENYCDQAIDASTTQQRESTYCTKWFKIDGDGDGKADKFSNDDPLEDRQGQNVHYYCSATKHTSDDLAADRDAIGVGCAITC